MQILIIDDEALIRKSLKRAFEAKGHQVLEAEDGEAGLKIWKENNPDLVILDVLMPKLTGPQLLAEIGDLHDAKVAMISAYTGEYDRTKALELGADLFIPKPFQNIFDVVDKTLALVD